MESLRTLSDSHSSSLVATSLLLLCTLFLPYVFGQFNIRHRFPLVGNEVDYKGRMNKYLTSAYTAYEEGYKRFKTTFHRLTTLDGDHIIIPNQYLDELRRRGDDEIDQLQPFFKDFNNKYTRVFPERSNTLLVQHIVKSDLTRSLTRINPRLSEEVQRTVKSELPPCEDWSPVPIWNVLLRIVAIVSGHIFLGPDMCRRPEYIRAAVDYTVDITTAVRVLKQKPAWLCFLYARILPEFVRLRQDRQDMKQFLSPLIDERRRAIKAGEALSDDMLSWMLEKTEARGITDPMDLTEMQLLMTMAAIHTTCSNVTRIMYDLAVQPDTVEALRQEVKSLLEKGDGVMTTNILFDMKLMDSVMRESQRLAPAFDHAFRRYTLKPITLRDGTCIPANSYIEAANSPVLRDPVLYPNPDAKVKDTQKYDPYRFANLRTNAENPDPIGFRNREQYQFVSVTKENMSFGFGKHACPGRFFAANEIKLILARIFLDYELKMPNGQQEPYSDFHAGAINGPDPTGQLLMRKRRAT